MPHLTIDDLRRIMIACAGADDASNLSGEIADMPFEDLGYDSLALIETLAWISHQQGIRIPDPDLAEVQTPRQLLAHVNSVLTAGISA